MPFVRTALAAALLLASAACTDDEPSSAPDPSTTAGESDDPREQPTEPAPLDWKPTGYSAEDRVIVGEEWTAVITETDVVLESPAWNFKLPEVPSGTVHEVLLDGETAVVAYGFGGETVTGLGYRVDLMDRERTRIVTPEPANAGAWALADDDLYYPSLGEEGSYCLATLVLSDSNGEDGWCAPQATGFTSLTASEHGVALMTFDDARPVSCRTLHLLDGAGLPTPVEGPEECKGWDVAATSTGVVWSEVPRERRQETARFTATADGTRHDLGRGTTGTLRPCGGDTFFVRDPSGAEDPARLMRWDGAHLSVAFESASRGNVFLGEPECADGILTVSEFGEEGDRQVFAPVDG